MNDGFHTYLFINVGMEGFISKSMERIAEEQADCDVGLALC
jgi:hypothetical protein